MARQFNGTTQAGASASNLNLSAETILSVGYWLWWDAFGTDNDLAMEFTADGTGTAAHGFTIDPNGGGGDHNTWFSGSAAATTASWTRASAAAWHHYLWIFDTTVGTTALYLDGTGQTPTASSSGGPGGFFALDTLYLMSRAGTSLFGAGRMADLAIWNSALTGGNATSLAAGARADTVGTPSFYWRIDGTTSPEPNTLGGVDMTLVASPTFVADPPAFTSSTVGPRSVLGGGIGGAHAGQRAMVLG